MTEKVIIIVVAVVAHVEAVVGIVIRNATFNTANPLATVVTDGVEKVIDLDIEIAVLYINVHVVILFGDCFGHCCVAVAIVIVISVCAEGVILDHPVVVVIVDGHCGGLLV